MEYKNPGKLFFKAKLIDAGGGGVFINIPLDVYKTFGAKNLIPIRATFDSEPYRGRIANMGEGPILIVLKTIRNEIDKRPGDIVDVSIELDEEPRIVELPDDFKKMPRKNTLAFDNYNKLSYTHKKEYVTWITEAKRPETRNRRLLKTIEILNENNEVRA